MNIRRNWLSIAVALVAVLALVGMAGAVSAAFPAQQNAAPAVQPQSAVTDDFDSLQPPGLKAVSYSVLVNSGKVHVFGKAGAPPASNWSNPFVPLLNIIWGADHLTGAGAGEPAAGINQTLPLNALISGNFSLDHTTDGGLTWTSIQPPNPHNSGDVTNAWLENAPSNALELSINNSGGYDYTCARTTDFGVTWATDAACGPSVSSPVYFDDREYIWVDHTPSSPFYGRVYVTTAYFDAGGSGSFNTVSNRWSSDNGVSWNPPNTAPIALVPNNEFATGVAHNEYPSLGISANGTLGYAWRRGLCCGSPPTVGTNDKVMFARSTDGGVTFPFSNTIVTVPLANAISFNSNSPFGPRWSDTPNIAADPVTNGTFYAIWTQYRTANTAASAAVYLSKTTDNGATWSTPVIPYNNPNANIFQGFGWVKVTADHTVHVTYFGGTTTNTAGSQFYVQSTDGGATWTAPFQLNTINPTISGFASTTDYEAMDVTLSGGPGAILAGWDDQTGHHARLGTFVQGTPTPTVTGTPPTVTPTRTFTQTPTASATPCQSSAIVNGGFETGSLAPWTVLGTNPAPVVSNALPHSGTYAALLGTLSGPEPLGDGSIYQTITVPAGGGTLSYWWNGSTTDTITFDWQDAYITDTSGTILATIMHNCSSTGGYINQTFNMAPYAGQTVRVEFLVHQDGFGDDTAMYVDDVQLLTACGTAGPTNTPTRTVTPGGATATITATPTCVAQAGGWSAGPDLPTTLVRAIGVYWPTNGHFYSVGGRTSDAAGSDFQHVLDYNPGTNTWTQMPSTIPDNFMNNMACGVLTVGGTPQIYCVGGSFATGTTATARVFSYNPATDTVTTLASGDNWPGDAGGTILPGGFAVVANKLYTIGGFNINVGMVADTWQFDPTAAVGSKWTAKANLPVARGYVPATTIGGLIYTAGGSDYVGGAPADTTDSYKYDPVANTWTAIAMPPRAVAETRAVTVGGQMWVLGGGRDAPNPNNEVDVYTPGSNTWAVGTPFSTARRNFPADSNGSTVWLAGGYDSSGTTALSSMEIYRPGAACGTPGPTFTPTTVSATQTPTTVSATNTRTAVVATSTATAVNATATPTVAATATVCPIQFTDVLPADPFYSYIRCLACRNIISGYTTTPPCAAGQTPCYNGGANVTRGQVAKIVSNAAGYNDPIPSTTQTFTDVPYTNPFWVYIERLAEPGRGFISGYSTSPPCTTGTPCFLPFNNVTRGQMAKIDSNAGGFFDAIPSTQQTFTDVPYSNPFWVYIERAALHGVISGYSTSPPCPGGTPCFLWANNLTRNQAAKIVAVTFYPNCQTPLRAPSTKLSSPTNQ